MKASSIAVRIIFIVDSIRPAAEERLEPQCRPAYMMVNLPSGFNCLP
jgi:hypothetical protein